MATRSKRLRDDGCGTSNISLQDNTAALSSAPATASPSSSTVTEHSTPVAFESHHVHQVYEAIAGHFSSTRYKAWPLVKDFVAGLAPGSLMVDVGCGNGKNLALSNHVVSIGCDYSSNLLRLAKEHREMSRSDVLRADGLFTPFRADSFDAAISIAVIHHFSTEERRRDSIKELLRVVRPGGEVLIYVWAKEQPKQRGDGSSRDVLIPWEMHKNFDTEETVHSRYYHLFEKGELDGLCSSLDSICDIKKSFYDKENWCVILTKK